MSARRSTSHVDASIASRRASAQIRALSNAVYVVSGDAYRVHRVTRRVVVLQCVTRPCSFLVFEGAYRPDASRWRAAR